MEPSELLLYASIPIVSAIVGWGTNVLAIYMTFYPIEFKGIPPFLGWQGIIPSKARKMASKTVDLMTTKLVGVEEIISRLEAERIVEEIKPAVDELLIELINDVVNEQSPKVWATVPESIKQEIYKKAIEDSNEVILESFLDIRNEIEDILDIKRMSIEALMRDKTFLVDIFLECGKNEFKFIERSGIGFGFIFGLIQMIIWYFYKGSWLLPTAGFLVGWATNFLALKMIFEPLQPKKIGGFTWQGMFLKRQDEVSEAYARMITGQIVSTQNIINEIFHGPTTQLLLDIIEKHVEEATERFAGPNEVFFNLIMGTERHRIIRERFIKKIVEEVPDGPAMALTEYADEAMNLETTMRERLRALPPEDFVGLLRPIFQEDEWKLILVGAVLGLIAGLFQLFVVFGQDIPFLN